MPRGGGWRDTAACQKVLQSRPKHRQGEPKRVGQSARSPKETPVAGDGDHHRQLATTTDHWPL